MAGADTQIGNRILDHGCDTLRVTSTIVRQSRRRGDIKALSASWGVWVDDNVAIGIGLWIGQYTISSKDEVGSTKVAYWVPESKVSESGEI